MSESGYLDELFSRIARNQNEGDRRLRRLIDALVLFVSIVSTGAVVAILPVLLPKWAWIAPGLAGLLAASYWFQRVAREVALFEDDPRMKADDALSELAGMPVRPTPWWWKLSAPLAIAAFFGAVYFAASFGITYATAALVSSWLGSA